MDKKHIFLSYCRENLKEVSALRDELTKAGETVWWDQDISTGKDWKTEVKAAIKESYAVIICLSKEINDRTKSVVFYEVSEAIGVYREYPPNTIFLIPVRLSECSIPPINIDDTRTLVSLQFVDLFPEENYQSGIKRLLDSIKNVREYPKSKSRNEDVSKENFCFCSFLHTKITGTGLFDIDQNENPHLLLTDPTDYQHELPSQTSVFLWLPNNQCISTTELPRFTPVVAICTVNPNKVSDTFQKSLKQSTFDQLEKPARKLRNEEKEEILSAAANSLENCFIVAVAIPSLLIKARRTRLELAYQNILNLFLIPIIEKHRRLGVGQLHVCLPNVGEKNSYLLKSTKSAIKAIYPTKNAYSADFIRKQEDLILQNMARIIAWTVGNFYNSNNSRWITLLEDTIKKNNQALST